jgi:catechol 2,3-dioxygenase-like lactoylglutathione lyase family enzyme
MIRGVHTMFYSSEPEALRAFLRDKLGLPAHDVGGGWLIFDMPGADMGVHPASVGEEGAETGTHSISFYCDDIQVTMNELAAKGVEFIGPAEELDWGYMAFFKVPGGFHVQLYQPKYAKKR